MLRITITDGALEQRWILQGRLVAPWVAELEMNWKKSHTRQDVRKCVVDLSEVTLIDKRGEKVLKAMRRAGADLIARGVYIKHVVEDIDCQCKRKVKAQPLPGPGTDKSHQAPAPAFWAGRRGRTR